MTVTNFDIKNDSMQEKPPYEFSLVRASDLMTEINDIQNFLTSVAIVELSCIVGELQNRQASLVSEVSIIIHYLMTNSRDANV